MLWHDVVTICIYAIVNVFSQIWIQMLPINFGPFIIHQFTTPVGFPVTQPLLELDVHHLDLVETAGGYHRKCSRFLSIPSANSRIETQKF